MGEEQHTSGCCNSCALSGPLKAQAGLLALAQCRWAAARAVLWWLVHHVCVPLVTNTDRKKVGLLWPGAGEEQPEVMSIKPFNISFVTSVTTVTSATTQLPTWCR